MGNIISIAVNPKVWHN